MSEVRWLREFGERLTWLMDYTWTSQDELAKILGVSKATVSRYMRGLQMPDIDTVVIISRELNYDINRLIDFGENVY